MENNNEAMETENFYYEDIVDGVNMLLTKETLAVFAEAGISKEEIINKVEDNLPPIFDNENLDSYCKRFLQFILIEQLNNNFADNVDQKARLNKVSLENGEKPHVENSILKRFFETYESGDYAGLYNVISKASAILTLAEGRKVKPHYMDKTQLKVYQKYIIDFRKSLLTEISKISIPQPVYENSELVEDEIETEDDFQEVDENVISEETEVVNETDNIENDVEELDDDLQEFEDEDKYELEENEEYEIEDNEESILEDEDDVEDNEIDTDSILASIDELDDELPGFEDETETELDVADELDEELPGFENETELDSADELDEELPGFEDETETELDVADELDEELPGFEDETELELDSVEELDEELPGFEDETETELDSAEELDEELPGFEDETETELDSADELDEELPGFEDETETELDSTEELDSIEDIEEEKIIDEKRNYDLVFEDNYYEIPDVSLEYVEAHPDYKDSKFVEATGGTNLDDFISTMLYLKDTMKSEIVGIFNNVPLHTKGLKTVDEIENEYDKLVEEQDEEENKLKGKSECISYDEYYNQYIQKDVSRKAVKYQQEHNEIKMVLIPQNDATLEEFVDAALYFIQDDMYGTALSYEDITVIASDYYSKEEIYDALSGITKEDVKEDIESIETSEKDDITTEVSDTESSVSAEDANTNETEAAEDEVFDKTPEYYKSIAKISKSKTDAYRQRHPELKKVMIVVEREKQSVEDFFEAVRYYNSVNKNIIAQYDGIQLIARKYNSAEEMIEAYKLKKSKKTK